MSDHCYVCSKTLEAKKTLDSASNMFRVTCPRCGTYDVSHKFIASRKHGGKMSAIEWLTLSHAIRRATDSHQRFGQALLDHDTVNGLVARYPLPDPVEQADILVDSIARRSSFGRPTPLEPHEVWLARIGVMARADLQAMQEELVEFIKPATFADEGKSIVGFQLTLEGWTRAREIRKERGPGDQAFVAMWFHADMDAAFDQGFDPALRATGHQPYRVDRDAHNNKIDDQIVAQIRRSKLVIVDTTGARPNAYFEAGFAMGLGIPVIWCCCDCPTAPGLSSGKTWEKKLPFDIRQHAFTFWSDPADLREKLTARIRALGFDAAWNRGQ